MLLLLGAAMLGAPAASTAAAPIDEDTYRAETTGGAVFIGPLVAETEDDVTLETDFGTVTIRRAHLERFQAIDPARIRSGVYWFDNPQPTRHLFTPNALSLGRGQGYYQNAWIFFNNVNYGISDHVSIGGGLVPTFLFGASEVPFWLLPKASVSLPDVPIHLAGGAMIGGVIGNSALGLLYAISTVGTADRNLSVGVGYGYEDGSLARRPALNVSGVVRLSASMYLVTENYVLPSDGGVLSAGLRWAPENFAVDFGLIRPVGADIGAGFIGVPWLGVAIPFGR